MCMSSLAYIDDMPVSDMKQTLDTIAHLHQKVKISTLVLKTVHQLYQKRRLGGRKYGRNLQNTGCMKTGLQWRFIHVLLLQIVLT